MATVLLTGFEPFAGDRSNPSGDAVQIVAAQWTGPEELVTEILPVTFEGSRARMTTLITRHRPDLVIAAGLAGGRGAIGVERVAVNLVDARIPDNDGSQPVDVAVTDGAPAAYFSSLPVKAIARDLERAGIPAEVSHSAGTFVCNHVFFVAMDAVAPGVRCGFVHVPWSRESSPSSQIASLPLHDIAHALEIAVRTSLGVRDDIRTPGGSLHGT
jgi:pyroglutamyl-peptidase